MDNEKTYYFYSGWNMLSEYDDSGSLKKRFVYGASVDEPLIEITSSGERTFLHADRVGSIVARSNSSGNQIATAAYSPAGQSKHLSQDTFGFAGQRFDAETGLCYFKHRFYSPSIGRFIQPDPLGLASDDLNLYSYVQNDPLNNSDPYGLFLNPGTTSGATAGAGFGPLGAVIGAVIGTIIVSGIVIIIIKNSTPDEQIGEPDVEVIPEPDSRSDEEQCVASCLENANKAVDDFLNRNRDKMKQLQLCQLDRERLKMRLRKWINTNASKCINRFCSGGGGGGGGQKQAA